MNRLQKIAWFILAVWFLLAVLVILGVFEMLTSGEEVKKVLRFWLVFSFVLISVLTVVLLYLKRSARKVDFDERDQIIANKATNVAFIGVWVLLLFGGLCPFFIVGDDGWIPAQMPLLLNFGVFLDTALIYAIAVLVQYGWGGRSGKE